jgi:hypothetical protein
MLAAVLNNCYKQVTRRLKCTARFARRPGVVTWGPFRHGEEL